MLVVQNAYQDPAGEIPTPVITQNSRGINSGYDLLRTAGTNYKDESSGSRSCKLSTMDVSSSARTSTV